jgi:hypothetical protein
MTKEAEEIRKKFAGKLVGRAKMQELVCETLLILPPEIIDFVTKNVWFVSSFDDAWGFVLKGKELDGKDVIFLADKLFVQEKLDQRYEIAHEVGHVILKHRNAISKPQTKQEIARQEKEADRFARRYLKL